jgi:hypothetical protein
MSTRLRVDISGFVAIALNGYEPPNTSAEGAAVICLTPDASQHRPRLRVDKSQVESYTVPPTVVGNYLYFDVSNYNLLFENFEMQTRPVKLPPNPAPDPDGDTTAELRYISFLAAMSDVTGFSALKREFSWPCTSPNVVSTMLLRGGELQAFVNIEATATPWVFWHGDPELTKAPWRLTMRLAHMATYHEWVEGPVVLGLLPRTIGERPERIVFKPLSKVRVLFLHECDKGEECREKTVSGKQFEPFYNMLAKTARRPLAMPTKDCDLSYCPPGAFWD